MNFAGMMVVAMLLDLALGWPDPVYRRIGHPVTWIGALIRWIDLRFNLETDSPAARRTAGVATLIIVTAAAAVPMALLQHLLP
ncbi:MAG: cobalamin biosynthesis protein, partial [Cypionkella sp.]